MLDDPRWNGYVVPRASNANYAWILHIISKLDVNHGIAGFLLANGALNDPDEYENRKRLLMNDKVEAIIVLPRDMFYTTDISVTLWIVNMNKMARTVNGRQLRDRSGEVLFMDLRRWDSNVEEIVIDKGKKKKKTVLTDEQIAEAKRIYNNWQSTDTSLYQDVPELCKAVKVLKKDKVDPNDLSIEEKDWALAPSKYIEFIDHDLDIDYDSEMARIQNEMRLLMTSEELSQSMLKDAFKGIGYEIN